jgi:23S rRNA (guanine745-N1)-methyltransferase
MPMLRYGMALRCQQGHSFDVSRHGYVNLDVGSRSRHNADTAPMVAARQRFLNHGHYAPIADAVSSFATRFELEGAGVVLELAGGPGYYLAAVVTSVPASVGICMDLSKPALRKAATIHPRVAAIGRDVWQALPMADGSASIVMSIFGPRNMAETVRVLRPGGIFLRVTPTAEHLTELVKDLGMLSVDAAKAQRLAMAVSDLRQEHEETLTYQVMLDHSDIHDLVGMGPSAYHISPDQLGPRIAALQEALAVTVSVTVAAYRVR